jgi:hypothetical protein
METTSPVFIYGESGIGTRHGKSVDLYSGTSGRLSSEIALSVRESGIERGLGTDGIEKSQLYSEGPHVLLKSLLRAEIGQDVVEWIEERVT